MVAIAVVIAFFDLMSAMAMFRHLRQPPRGGGSDNVRFDDNPGIIARRQVQQCNRRRVK